MVAHLDALIAGIQGSHARWTVQNSKRLPKPRFIFCTSRRYARFPYLRGPLAEHIVFTGGGGTFGVVLESTILASPRVTLQIVLVSFTPTPSNSTLNKELWTILTDNGLKWANEGWGGSSISGLAILINPKLTKEEAAVSMEPLIAFGQRLVAEKVQGAQLLVAEFPSWKAFVNAFTKTDVAVRYRFHGLLAPPMHFLILGGIH
jgi:hypothetical protein